MKGRIIAIKADLFSVLCDGELLKAHASRLFQMNEVDLKVGDEVEIKMLETKNKAYIVGSYPRINALDRPPIANVNLAMVAISVKEPIFNDNLLDRFLTILSFNNIETAILFTKWDLLVGEEINHMNEIVSYYERIGYTCFRLTTKDAAPTALLDLIKGKICVIAGQSGVGKSTFLNQLDPSLNLPTDEISEALGRGKHTTRHVEIYRIGETWIADTPGFGTMDFRDFTGSDIAHNFVELFEASKHCKFKMCLHKAEPGCEVRRQVDNGTIKLSRYNNYLQFLQEVKRNKRW